MNKQRQRHGFRSVGLTLGTLALAVIVVVGGTGLLLRMAAARPSGLETEPAGPGLQHYVTPAVDARGTRVQFHGPPGWKLSPQPHRGKAQSEPTTALFTLTPGPPAAALPVWLRRFVPRWWLPKAEPHAVMFVMMGPLSTAPGSRVYDGKILTTRGLVRLIKDPVQLPPRLVFHSRLPHRPFQARRALSSPDGRYWLRVIYLRENKTAFNNTYVPICQSLGLVEPVP